MKKTKELAPWLTARLVAGARIATRCAKSAAIASTPSASAAHTWEWPAWCSSPNKLEATVLFVVMAAAATILLVLIHHSASLRCRSTTGSDQASPSSGESLS